MTNKYCFVPYCYNSSFRVNIQFVRVPLETNLRKLWFAAVKRDINSAGPTSELYCCDAHFDIQTDFKKLSLDILPKLREKLNGVVHIKQEISDIDIQQNSDIAIKQEISDIAIKQEISDIDIQQKVSDIAIKQEISDIDQDNSIKEETDTTNATEMKIVKMTSDKRDIKTNGQNKIVKKDKNGLDKTKKAAIKISGGKPMNILKDIYGEAKDTTTADTVKKTHIDKPKNGSKDTIKLSSKPKHKDTSTHSKHKDTPKHSHKNKDTTKTKDTSKHKDTPKHNKESKIKHVSTGETSKTTLKHVSKDPAKIVSKEPSSSSEEVSKTGTKDKSKHISKDVSKTVSKSVSKTVRDIDTDVSTSAVNTIKIPDTTTTSVAAMEEDTAVVDIIDQITSEISTVAEENSTLVAPIEEAAAIATTTEVESSTATSVDDSSVVAAVDTSPAAPVDAVTPEDVPVAAPADQSESNIIIASCQSIPADEDSMHALDSTINEELAGPGDLLVMDTSIRNISPHQDETGSTTGDDEAAEDEAPRVVPKTRVVDAVETLDEFLLRISDDGQPITQTKAGSKRGGKKTALGLKQFKIPEKVIISSSSLPTSTDQTADAHKSPSVGLQVALDDDQLNNVPEAAANADNGAAADSTVEPMAVVENNENIVQTTKSTVDITEPDTSMSVVDTDHIEVAESVPIDKTLPPKDDNNRELVFEHVIGRHSPSDDSLDLEELPSEEPVKTITITALRKEIEDFEAENQEDSENREEDPVVVVEKDKEEEVPAFLITNTVSQADDTEPDNSTTSDPAELVAPSAPEEIIAEIPLDTETTPPPTINSSVDFQFNPPTSTSPIEQKPELDSALLNQDEIKTEFDEMELDIKTEIKTEDEIDVSVASTVIIGKLDNQNDFDCDLVKTEEEIVPKEEIKPEINPDTSTRDTVEPEPVVEDSSSVLEESKVPEESTEPEAASSVPEEASSVPEESSVTEVDKSVAVEPTVADTLNEDSNNTEGGLDEELSSLAQLISDVTTSDNANDEATAVVTTTEPELMEVDSENSIENTSVDNTSVDNISVDNTSVDNTSVDNTSIDIEEMISTNTSIASIVNAAIEKTAEELPTETTTLDDTIVLDKDGMNTDVESISSKDSVEITSSKTDDDKIKDKETSTTPTILPVTEPESGATTLKRTLDDDAAQLESDSKKQKLNGYVQKSFLKANLQDKPVMTMEEFRLFMAKKTIAGLTRRELEQFTLQKICEAINFRSNAGELYKIIKQQEAKNEALLQKNAFILKQVKDLEIVHGRMLQELRSRLAEANTTMRELTPIKITRSVGLQVSLINPVQTRIRQMPPPPLTVVNGTDKPPTSGASVKRKMVNQRASLPNKMLNTMTPAKQFIPPKTPLQTNSKFHQAVTPPPQKGIKTLLPKTYSPQKAKENTTTPSTSSVHQNSVLGNYLQKSTAPAAAMPNITAPVRKVVNNTTTQKVIDLTDEDDNVSKAQQKPMQKTLATNIRVVQQSQHMNNNNTQTVTSPTSIINQNGTRVTYLVQSPNGGATGQPVLLATSTAPNRPGQTRSTIMFKQVAPGQVPPQSQRVSMVRQHPNSQQQAGVANSMRPQIRFTNSAQAAMNAATTATNSRQIQMPNRPLRHPAPLPASPAIQASQPNWKAMPPQPILKISKAGEGIVLSWKMTNKDLRNYEEIASYQLYAYQETTAPPSTDMWRKVGDVKALALPMACTLTQFTDGNKYHFAVRAVDVKTRVGPFSSPEQCALP